ncbi:MULTISPECIES: ATP-binding domain-containing protein [unclassified Sphingomonas]|jgi:superfamily I DNA/RNA helicase|uniref:ATP-binding domain-containing protein n=1 Tax=unclassified Sphingomonas TaxID=196159 RepID=UPI0009E67F70|nr:MULTISPECIES: ATP-binding domain-containing protein [unclassified Sphingomonas]
MEASWWTRTDQLDDEQKDVIALPLQGSFLVIGPPGSGKTNLLLLRAAFMQAKGRNNYQVLTFGRVLKEFLVNGTDANNVEPERIRTYRMWAGDVLREYGIEISTQADFDTVRQEILKGLQGLSDDEVLDHKLDCLLLDEAQDYSKPEIEQLVRFADHIFAAGDSNQAIYRDSQALNALTVHCDEVRYLSYHYRNGRKICRVADGIRGMVGKREGLEAASQYDEIAIPSEVIAFPSESLDAQVNRAIPIIADQLRAYPTAFIGVICPLKRDLQEVHASLARSYLAESIQLQMFETGYSPLDPERRVLVGTVHGAKGLEFRAVHLLAADGIGRFPKNRTKIAYTAVTRAKTSLAIYREGALTGRLENGLSALEPAPASVDLDSLFKS